MKHFFASAAIAMLVLFAPGSRVAGGDHVKLNMVFVPASEKGDEQDYENLIKIIEKL